MFGVLKDSHKRLIRFHIGFQSYSCVYIFYLFVEIEKVCQTI